MFAAPDSALSSDCQVSKKSNTANRLTMVVKRTATAFFDVNLAL